MRSHDLCLPIYVVVLCGCVACSKKSDTVNTTQLLGDWTTGPTETEWGSCIVEITLRPNGSIRWAVRPTSGADPIVEDGKYALLKGKLISDLLNEGKPIPVSIEGATLVMKRPGEPAYQFQRKAQSNQ